MRAMLQHARQQKAKQQRRTRLSFSFSARLELWIGS
jgi:hypothetical protein